MSTVKATFNGFVGHEGVPVLLHDGDEYEADHPLVEARPELFTEPEPEPELAPKRVLGRRGKPDDDD